MKKIVLGGCTALTLVSQTLFAEVAKDQEKLQADIASAEAEKKAIEAKIKALKSQLPPNEDIMTKVRLGYIKTKGNSNTETFSLYAKAKKKWAKKHKASLVFDGQYGKNEGVQTVNKFLVEANYGYAFMETLSATLVAGYKQDEFSSYYHQIYVGPGVKWKAYKSDIQKLSFEGSILYANDDPRVTNSTLEESYASYRAKLLYSLKMMDNLKFDQELSYRGSFSESDNYFVYSRSALSSKLSDIFTAGISYKIDYTNIVAPGIEKQDDTLEAFLTLEY